MPPRKRRHSSEKIFKWMPKAVPLVLVGIVLIVGGGLTYAAHIEDGDAFCASCHTQPESTYYQRTQDRTAVDLASAHTAKGVTCIQCHSGPGIPGRVSAMTGIAATDLLAYLSGHYHNPAIVTVPVGDDHCLKCHGDLTRNQNFNNHFHLFLSQWQQFDPKNAATCVSCHQSHATSGKADIAFLDEVTTVEVCQRCHNGVGAGG